MVESGGGIGHGWPEWPDESGPTIPSRVMVRPDVEPPTEEERIEAALQRLWFAGFWRGFIVAGLMLGASFIAGAWLQ